MTVLSSNNQWELFGFDLRQLGRVFSRAWEEVFWAYHSPVRQSLDVSVSVTRWLEVELLSLADNSVQNSRAIILPSAYVLIRRLTLPRSALGNLTYIVDAEVTAASPFLVDDTATGYRVDDTGGSVVTLSIAIVSRSGVLGLLHENNPNISESDYELWAGQGDHFIVLAGFAETERNRKYKKRLMRSCVYAAMGVVTLIVLMALPWIYQHSRLSQMEDVLAQSRHEAKGAMTQRNQLAENNAKLQALQVQINTAEKPLEPLTILTRALNDDAWLGEYEQNKGRVTIDGYAQDAAALIQQLTASDEFYGVKPLSAIRKVRRGQVERFRLELQLPSYGKDYQ